MTPWKWEWKMTWWKWWNYFMEMEDDMMEENEELIGKIGLFKLKELF